MDRWVGKVAIVTGASAGIGREIAIRLVEEGLKVVAVARRKVRLESLAINLHGKKGKLYPFKADISKEDELVKVFEWTKENVGLVHILINNAAVSYPLLLSNFKTEHAKAIYDLNVHALAIATKEVLKVFKENKISGHIININSGAGHQVPTMDGFGIYSGSKYAVTALTKSTFFEIQKLKLGAKVTSISPGIVNTEILTPEIRNTLQMTPDTPILQPVELSNSVIYVLSTPPRCQIQELTIVPGYVRKN